MYGHIQKGMLMHNHCFFYNALDNSFKSFYPLPFLFFYRRSFLFKIILNEIFCNFERVKKLISILLLTLYLVSTTELYQLLKMPLLVEHYIQHKDLNPEMSLTTFLKTHYDHPVKDSDHDQDQRLPFVSHASLLSVAFTLNPNLDFHFTEKVYNTIEIKKTFYKSALYNKEILNSIWQPPKFRQS